MRISRFLLSAARRCVVQAIFVCVLVSTASAWIYPEHRDITLLAIRKLDPTHRAVFEKLYRGSASAGMARGAGLGLAIAHAMVQAHGGRIWATNRPGGGAVFAFTLPLEPAPTDLVLDDESGGEEEA